MARFQILFSFDKKTQVMKINKNIAISESGFIFNPSNGDSFSTNAVGSEIIRHLKDGSSKEEIISELTKTFQIDASTLEKDLGDFFLMLQNYQLLNE
ncbi:MAG: PqqD family protein [Flavobacteriales bacterium]|nr:PqqD family protein [Crocinitomicaceae bacterium]NBX79775.1 PqqD family protein [Flavobacteriales bacterium]NCA20569.1 PqqD family protein [Crocinitomicaceae bacterium]